MRSRCQTPQYPPLCCNTDHSTRLPTTSLMLAFMAEFIFEPTRMQERVWAERSAAQSTRTTCLPCMVVTGMFLNDCLENDSQFGRPNGLRLGKTCAQRAPDR